MAQKAEKILLKIMN